MTRTTLPLTSIIVGDRARHDLGTPDEQAKLRDSIVKYGLIQPIVVNQDNLLVAGGRRYHAHVQLDLPTIEVCYKETLSQDHLREMELEENVRRKDMAWQERAMAIAEIHRLKVRTNALEGQSWGQWETGEMLNMSTGNVSNVLWVARELRARASGSALWSMDGLTNALKYLINEAEQIGNGLLAKMTLVPTAVLAPASASSNEQNGSAPATDHVQDTFAPASAVLDGETITFKMSNIVAHADALARLASLPPACVDAIITDPPYAIDMAMLQQENTGMDVSTTAAEHDVDANIRLLAQFLPLAYRVLKDKSFCIICCDAMLFPTLVKIATDVGFSACRWPLVWCKPTSMNQAAGYNFTKATEFALVLRKGNATLRFPQKANWFLIDVDPADKLFAHPFAKPYFLWKRFIEATTSMHDLVLDPFAGSGSCPCACVRLYRQPLAIETNELHFNQLVLNVQAALVAQYSSRKVIFES